MSCSPDINDHAQSYLAKNGWRLVQSRRTRTGFMNYWDHPQYQREDGCAWKQREALKIQRNVDRDARKEQP